MPGRMAERAMSLTSEQRVFTITEVVSYDTIALRELVDPNGPAFAPVKLKPQTQSQVLAKEERGGDGGNKKQKEVF